MRQSIAMDHRLILVWRQLIFCSANFRAEIAVLDALFVWLVDAFLRVHVPARNHLIDRSATEVLSILARWGSDANAVLSPARQGARFANASKAD